MSSYPAYCLVFILFLAGCASESTSWSSKAFHNTTAHYNGYYYANDEIRKIENTIRSNLKDDYNRVLRLFPGIDSVLALSYDEAIQEAIKMASIAIQRHPNSKWVDDSYILVGKARLYSLDWGNAIQTFKYVNTKSKDADARHRSLLWLARTFTEHGEYANAESVFDFLAKEKLNRTNKKNLFLEKAYHYQVREDDDKFVRNLSSSVPYLKKKDKPGRIYFIIGQVYQKLGFEAEAYNYFRDCLQTNPDYEIDFYARLYMAQVAEISKSRNIANARRSFRKLLKDSKNKEFRDKIYYEMGVFEGKQNNINEAIANYELAVREGSNKQIDGEAYLKLGEIYYDTLRKYETAKAYYDSAVASLSKDYENYPAIKSRQEILTEFVTQLKTIQWQDSLFVLAKMDSASLMALVKKELEKLNPPEDKKGKKKRNRIEINQVSTSFGNEPGFGSSDWYFGSTSAIALGQQEFQRVWGNIPLEDNWRRSSRSMPTTSRVASSGTSAAQNESGQKVVEETKADPALEAYMRISKELPRTPEDEAKALDKIENAYFQLADIYNFKLLEKGNAIAWYEKLLERFPNTEWKPEVLYKLYLLLKEQQPNKADRYASELVSQFPESSFAKILNNPDYLLESSLVQVKQKSLYQLAYRHYEQGEYDQAIQLINEALSLDKTPFTANLELLAILLAGKTEPVPKYQYLLDSYIKSYPDTELSLYAKKLLAASRDVELNREKEKGIRFRESLDGPHYFILIYKPENKLEDIVPSAMAAFNKRHVNEWQLKVSNLILDDATTMTLVTDIPDKSKAIEYYRLFTAQQGTLAEIKNHKFNTFVISKDNFDIFYRTKSLDEYIRFFEKNYITRNP